MADQTERDDQGVDPVEFGRRALAISREDATTVRERVPGTGREKHRDEGPSADYGDE